MGWTDGFKRKGASPAAAPFSYSARASAALSTTASPAAFSMEQTSGRGSFLQRARKAPVRPAWEEEPRRAGRSCGSTWLLLLAGLQLAGAAAVAAVTGTCLAASEDSQGAAEGAPPTTASACYLAADASACTAAYWVAGIGAAVSLALAALQCCAPRRRSAFCLTIESGVGLLGALWWAAAGTAALAKSHESGVAGWPHGDCRTAVWGACYAVAALFLLAFATSALGCCTACGRRREEQLAELDA